MLLETPLPHPATPSPPPHQNPAALMLQLAHLGEHLINVLLLIPVSSVSLPLRFVFLPFLIIPISSLVFSMICRVGEDFLPFGLP